MQPSTHAFDVLARNRLQYQRLVDLVADHPAEDGEGALRRAMVAATFAWHAPTGLLGDTRLERLVVAAVRGSGDVTVDGGRSAGRVLHVLSEAYSIGGHSRLAWTWMTRDGRRSDVALTNHEGPVPEQLLSPVTASGGHLTDLRAHHPTLLARATALRALIDEADLVVLHVHPYDVIALAAINLPGPRPPVIFENHADHCFWLGLTSSEVVSHFRPFGERLSVDLRGVSPDRCAQLPLPVDALSSSVQGSGLRHNLGIRADAVVAVTVAATNKISALCGSPGMDRLLDAVLSRNAKLVVILVGTPPVGVWGRLAERFPGRLLPVGSVLDPAPYYAAADLYLESYPTRSGTSVLEAATLGLPVVALTDVPDDDLLSVYQAPSASLLDQPTATTPERFTRMVRDLVADPGLRARRGEEVRTAVTAAHGVEGWSSGLEALYAHARRSTAVAPDEAGEPVEDPRYGAALVAFGSGERAVSPPPSAAVSVLRELADDGLVSDVFAVSHRDDGRPLTVRVAPGWEHERAWSSRLLALSAAHRRLSVSLPFVAGDDITGARSEAVLVSLLAGLGQTPDDCGDISVDTSEPTDASLRLAGELLLTDTALDGLERLLSSPGWGIPDRELASAARSSSA